MTTLPKFSNYIEEGKRDSGYEALQDFYISWTLRCSPENYRTADQKVQEYARRMVYTLIYGDNSNDNYGILNVIPDDFRVLEIETRRQLGQIDLIALLSIQEGHQTKKYLLSIENKWYSKLSDSQFAKYNDFVIRNFRDYIIINLFITCDDCRTHYAREKEMCRLNNYKYLTVGDLASAANIYIEGKTGNALFDEYWCS